MSTRNTGNSRDTELVYSTEGGGRVEPGPPEPVGPPGGSGEPVRVGLERAGRRGKAVTVISGLPPGELTTIGRELKRLCGAGGSVKKGVVEIQGDHRDRVVEHLSDRFRVRRSG